MEFRQYLTSFRLMKISKSKKVPAKALDFYNLMHDSTAEMWGRFGMPYEAEMVHVEHLWYKNRAPYYKVYPAIIDALLKIPLDVPMEFIKLPVEPIEIMMPMDCSLSYLFKERSHYLHGMMFGRSTLSKEPVNNFILCIGSGNKDLLIPKDYTFTQTNFYERDVGLPGFVYNKDETIEQVISRIKITNTDFVRNCFRILAGLCLLSRDDSIIQPEVLNDDLKRYEVTKDIKYVEKAIRRGKYGWNVGRELETIPHFRRPHLALFWTGEGRKVPVIKMRQGAVVHREIVGKMPTGYHLPEQKP